MAARTSFPEKPLACDAIVLQHELQYFIVHSYLLELMQMRLGVVVEILFRLVCHSCHPINSIKTLMDTATTTLILLVK